MADTEQVERLKRSVAEWNQWRQEHPEIRPDLSGADLSSANLSSANLSSANLIIAHLSFAHLSNANLSSANLSSANLIIAHLSSADLSSADLSSADPSSAHLNYANLSSAHLNCADLSGADLYSADLSSANLSSADLSGANLGYTVFADNDLSTVKGLVEVNHRTRSYVSLDTVKLPQDGSAFHFLRGAGIPEEWIDFYRSTMMHPIQYYSCFLSYSSTDEILARRLHADLQNQGVRCWFAPHDMRPGQLIRKGIDDAIHMQDKLLLILSKHSVESGWVGYEVETALSREIRQQREILFPIRIDDAVFRCTASWAVSLRDQRHIGDFTAWAEPERYQQVLERLLRDLKAQDAKTSKPE